MAKRAGTFDIMGVVNAHLARRPEMNIGGLDRLGVVARSIAFVERCGARVITGGRQPAYDPIDDVIYMPGPGFYWLNRLTMLKTTYSVCIEHELTHWSGHRSRLARPRHREQFDEIYRREELVAEVGSALLCHDLKITSSANLPHARYLNTYLATLPNAGVELDIALARANQAVGYLHAIAKSDRRKAA